MTKIGLVAGEVSLSRPFSIHPLRESVAGYQPAMRSEQSQGRSVRRALNQIGVGHDLIHPATSGSTFVAQGWSREPVRQNLSRRHSDELLFCSPEAGIRALAVNLPVWFTSRYHLTRILQGA